jgi:hypothetical protein
MATEVIRHEQEEISDQDKAKLCALAEKYADLIAHSDSLPQPLRAIAEFVKKEASENG